MKVCVECFGKLWPGLITQASARDNILHIMRNETEQKCDYCGYEPKIVYEFWFEE